MNTCERHVETGAYVLGALNDADATRFEEHLAECENCAAELDSLMDVEAALAENSAVTSFDDPQLDLSEALRDRRTKAIERDAPAAAPSLAPPATGTSRLVVDVAHQW